MTRNSAQEPPRAGVNVDGGPSLCHLLSPSCRCPEPQKEASLKKKEGVIPLEDSASGYPWLVVWIGGLDVDLKPQLLLKTACGSYKPERQTTSLESPLKRDAPVFITILGVPVRHPF